MGESHVASGLYSILKNKWLVVPKKKELQIDLDDIRIHERVKLVEKLPLSVYTKISDYIETVNKYNTDILTVDETELEIDAEFFDTSASD